MLRRNVRLRKEYLYRKGLEGKERAEYEKKRAIKRALEGRRCIVPLVIMLTSICQHNMLDYLVCCARSCVSPCAGVCQS
jgi:hypothetical protein